ncbi:hypothetical protein A3Q56_06325 [Intoshia linei]|uniref:Reverse transcriptase domain-containing protein n=1 Tax=Intoshia linei TaxID=1819745 RepID=A0A177AVU2_9BILA|nr:hypothetical protein A3Q56_06325 [Intoshia linei]
MLTQDKIEEEKKISILKLSIGKVARNRLKNSEVKTFSSYKNEITSWKSENISSNRKKFQQCIRHKGSLQTNIWKIEQPLEFINDEFKNSLKKIKNVHIILSNDILFSADGTKLKFYGTVVLYLLNGLDSMKFYVTNTQNIIGCPDAIGLKLININRFIKNKNFDSNNYFNFVISMYPDVICNNMGLAKTYAHSISLDLSTILKSAKSFPISINQRDNHREIIDNALKMNVIEPSVNIFNLNNGFWQILLKKSDCLKTAFSTSFGDKFYQYNVMPQGLSNAPATCQRVMDKVLKGINNVIVYLDDIIIALNSVKEHKIDLNNVLSALRKANFMSNQLNV